MFHRSALFHLFLDSLIMLSDNLLCLLQSFQLSSVLPLRDRFKMSSLGIRFSDKACYKIRDNWSFIIFELSSSKPTFSKLSRISFQ